MIVDNDINDNNHTDDNYHVGNGDYAQLGYAVNTKTHVNDVMSIQVQNSTLLGNIWITKYLELGLSQF